MNTFNPDQKRTTRAWWLRIPLLFASVIALLASQAQTQRIVPLGDGSFSNGGTFGANNWTEVNASNGPWVVGTLYNTAPFSSPSAYISLDGGVTSSYNAANPATSFFYRDVTVPAGETVMSLSFNWFQVGEGSWDIWQVWVAPTTVTPVASNTHPGSGTNTPVPPGITGATYVGNATAVTCSSNNTFTGSIPASFAGTTFRLIFSWKSDTSVGGVCPAAIDNISLTSAVPTLYTASALGGLWNSPASWVGGVVPPSGNHVTIPAGSTMVVNQSISYGDITVAGKMQWTNTTPSATVNTMTCTNLTIDPGGEFIANNGSGTAALTTGGATVNILGNFTNNGFANMAAGGTVLWFLAPSGTQTLGGTGTFLADMSGRGMIPNLLFSNLAASSITTTQDIVTNNLGATASTLTTNNKLHIDNTARANGALINRSVYTVVVTAHGTLYNSATPPTIGFTAAPAGGTTATAVANIDDVTGTLRSITITNPGNGYRVAPTVTISGGTGSGATAVAHLYSSYMFGTACQGQKSGTASTVGGINIPSNQGVAVTVTAGGTGYTSAPNIGVALPINFINLMENAGSFGGTGYTVAPSVTFSGGGALTQATGVAVVTRGQVTSVNITAGGTGYLSAPTITFGAGGNNDAVCVFNPAHLPTFSATVDVPTGMLVSVATTNPGFGYLAAPTVSLNPAVGAGGATTNATLVARASLYNLIHNWFSPSPTNVQHTESAFIPTNRRINAHSLTNALGVGMALTNNLTLYAAAPMTTFTGPIDMGGNTLAFDHPTYAGAAGSATVYVQNGSISHRLFGSTANQARNLPFNTYDATGAVNYLVNPGTATTVLTEGSTITYLKATQTGAPSGSNAVGTRALRLETNAGAMYGNLPSLRMSFNSIDNLGPVADNPNLFIAQSSALSGPWTAMSIASGVGPLAATGNRTTATTAPGPIVSGQEYFAWYSTYAPCVGDPTPGNTLSTTTNACPSVNFTLSLQNVTNGSGVTYQWESADDLAFTVNQALLGTANTQVTNQTTAKYYRCLVTCTVSTESEYSTPILVNMGGPCQCSAYCAVTNFGDGACITGVQINTLNSTTAACVPNPGYTLRGETTTLQRGLTYPITVNVNNLVYGGGIVSVWFDWNNNFVFEASEWFQPYTTGTTGSINVPVPLTATLGTIRMRVRSRGQGNINGAGDGCTASFGSGTCEDFCVTLEDPPACDAPPAANTTLSSAASVCIGANFTLSLQNSYAYSGITYQWESADDNAFTVNVASLGTNTTQVTSQSTAKYYRCAITCTNPGGGTTYSAPVLVNMNLFYSCYCQSIPTNTIDEEIYSVTVNGAQVGNIPAGSACTTAAPGAGSILLRYSNWVTGPTPHFSMNQGVSTPFIIEENECDGATFFAFGSSIWIDYNHDGDYLDLGEQVFVEATTLAGPRNVVGSFTPPLSSLTGLTGMRVIAAEGVSGAALVPCLNAYGYGETEDFLVDILPPPTPAQATATINDDCNLDTYTITVNIANFGSGTPGNISYTVNGGAPIVIPAVLGNNTLPTSGSFLQTDVVNITVTNNTISNLAMGNHYGGCPIDVICGNTVTMNHCYGNQDPRTFTFIGNVPTETLTLTFVSGAMQPGDVIRAYEGTDNTGTPIPSLTNSFANLAGVTGTSSTNEIFLEIDSDPTGSCQDAGAGTSLWVFEVECTPGCVDPDGTATYDLCTQLITVDVGYEGDAATTGVRYILNGGAPVDDPGHVAGDQVILGPFTPGDVVQVYLLHEGTPPDAACNKNLGTINIVAPTGQPTLVVNASPAVICAGQNSTLSAVASGGPGGVAQYVFQNATGGALADMTGATVVLGTGVDDTAAPMTAIGFTFGYGNNTYTQFSACSNGQISLTGLNANLGNDLANSTPRPVLTAWWDDLHTGSDGYVQHKIFGSPGSYIRVIEWKVRDYPGAGLPTTMLMQMWLYESGVIEMRYGAASAVSDGGASIGISGVSAGVFQSVTSPAHTVSTVTENISNSVWPGNGHIYRWLLPEVTGTTYAWSPATYLSATTGNTVTALAVGGTTTYTVTATVPGGCPESEDVTVTVNPPITAGTITPNPANFCTGGGSVLLTATPTDGVAPYTYAWTGPGGPAGTSNTQVAAVAGTWSCLISDACGGSVNVNISVTSSTPPTASITATSPICVGGSVTLTCNTDTGNGFLWTGAAPVGGSTTQSVTINSLTLANNGTYTCTANLNGCNSPVANYILAVNPSPTISSTTAVPNPVCSGSNTVLTVNASLPSSAYCTPGYTTGCTFPDIISNVTFAGINRSSLCDALTSLGYSNLASPQGNVVAGSTYTLSATTDGDTEGLTVWIDYNRNGTFEAGEIVLQRPAPLAPPATSTANVTIPLGAYNGATRMRVRCNYNAMVTDPCGSVTWGETEDYVINITGGADQLNYAWSGGTFLGGISNTQSVTATNVTVDPTAYSVLVSSGAGCTNTGNVNVNVLPLPVVTCGGPYGPYCMNDADVTLTGSPVGGSWSGTGVTPGGIFDPSVGSQTLTYSYNDGSCTNTCQVSITVFTTDTDGDGLPDCDDECPLLYGEIGDACDAGPLFVLGEIDPLCNCIGVACTTNLAIEFQTDGVTNIQWELRTQGSDILVQNGGGVYPQSPAYVINTCLPDGDFYLKVTSNLGGIVQNGVQGGYILRTLGPNQRVIDNRNNFLSGLTSQIAGGEGFHLPMGIDRLIWTSCDRLDWRAGEYVVANDNPAVSAEWGVGTQTDDGYEMWFYNPNGGYSFRRFHSHAVSDGFAPASATRACHIKINNWPAANHIPDGVLLNTKVRGRVNGVNAEWGPSCRFKRDEVRAQCPLTKLMDIPGNPYLSCGATRVVGPGHLVHARPVTRVNGNTVQSANKYQFRFRIPAENFTLVKTSATGNYWVNTAGLTNCKTYQVDVRASFDNGATWCTDWMLPILTDPWGDVCLLNTACSGDGGGENMSTSSDANVGLYPNPNRGDQVRLSIDRIEEGVSTVSVDIIDAFGKRVSARTIAVQDGFVNSIIDLDGSLAAGMYMVNITAGETFYTERLVIQP